MQKAVSSLLFLSVFFSIARGEDPAIGVYVGTLGKMSIELVVNKTYDDSHTVDGVYMYAKYNEPIPLEGEYSKKKLVLREPGGHTFVFSLFDDSFGEAVGKWRHAKTKKELPVRLEKAPGSASILQKQSLKRYFFRITRGSGDDFFESVEVSEKKSGENIGQVMATNWWSMESIVVGDAEKDGTGFLVQAESGRRMFGYRIDPRTNEIKRTCCESSIEDSLDIVAPNRFNEGFQER